MMGYWETVENVYVGMYLNEIINPQKPKYLPTRVIENMTNKKNEK